MRRKLIPLVGSFSLVVLLGLFPFSQARAGDKTEIQIYSNPFGNSTYVLSFALAEIVNKYSSKLHMTCLESKGSSANILYLQKNPEALKNTVVVGNQYLTTQAERADPPFTKPYKDLKAIALIGNMGGFLTTTNPAIKAVEDMAGKSLGLGSKGITIEYVPRFILQDGYGIFKDLGRVSYSTFDAIKDALIDGSLDVGLQSSALWGEDEYKDWAPIPATEELLATKACYLVDIKPEAFKRAREKSGYPIYFQKAKPLAFGKSKAFGGNRIIWSNSWWVDKSMDDDIVTEICSIIYDHAKEFTTYHATGRCITKKTVAEVMVPEAEFHPAAIKFYKEKGLKVGE
jgi:TRAP transporter TAXI family solute receptor